MSTTVGFHEQSSQLLNI